MIESNNHFDCAVCGLTNKDFKFYGIGECNHPICGVCAIKLLKFSKDNDNVYDYSKCVICKQNMSKVIISSSINTFESFFVSNNNKNNENNLILQNEIIFDGIDAHRFYRETVKIECQQCFHQFLSVSDLVEHIDIHNLRFCALCVQFNKCLPSEFMMMTDNDFHHHSCKEHPKCSFCNKRFYDNTQLIKHAKECHFLCDICHRRQGFVAYHTQDELLRHYVNDHYVCEICRSIKKINVFDSEYNLKTHKVLDHDKGGLVTEGLVSISYGDSNNRYGQRRRGVRDNVEVDNDLLDATTGTLMTGDNQQVPIIECEEAFPRLNKGNEPSISNNRQLGVRSVTCDDNDSRGAFGRPNIVQEESPAVTVDTVDGAINSKQAPQLGSSVGGAYRGTKYNIGQRSTAGIVTDSDFPSLSSYNNSAAAAKTTVSLEYSKVKNSVTSSTSNNSRGTLDIMKKQKTVNLNEDFPSLSSSTTARKHGITTGTAQSKWGHVNSDNNKMQKGNIKKNTPEREQHQQQQSPRYNNDTDIVLTQEEEDEMARRLAAVAKVQVVNREQFEEAVSNNTPRAVNNKQSLPQDSDFPSLSNSKNKGYTAGGVWGGNDNTTVTTQQHHRQQQQQQQQQQREDSALCTVDSLLDFPELPFSSSKNKKNMNMEHNSSKKNSNIKKKNNSNNFAATAASSSQKVYSLKSLGEQFQKKVDNKQPEEEEQRHHYYHQPTSSSLRGLDYVPCVVPINETVVLVDSKKFKDLKKTTNNNSNSERQLLTVTNNEDDYPSITTSTSTNNHFDILQDSSETFSKKSSSKVAVVNDNSKTAPKLSSNKDFPALGGRQSTAVVTNNTSAVQSSKKNNRKDNFTAATSSTQKSVTSLKSLGEQFQKKVQKVDNRQPEEQPDDQKHPSRTDYVPCVVPTNETVVLVDSEKFKDLKKTNANERQLSMTTLIKNEDQSSEAVVINDNSKTAPKLSSNTDFPQLGGRQLTASVAQSSNNINNNKKPQSSDNNSTTNKSREEECLLSLSSLSAPGPSLADIALSVTRKSYTAFSDNDQRNQQLFETVLEALENSESLAQQFLSLSSLYRNRAITVEDYLESLQQLDCSIIIGLLLPQMLVLLPDIALQRCLWTHMPKQWTAGLRECLLCGQIINRVDLEQHTLEAQH